MNISEGFRIEDPDVFVPWGIDENKLIDLLPRASLRKVTDGYYVIPCTSLGGLRHTLGFHFRPSQDGRLWELEFFLEQSLSSRTYREWQQHLERAFGKSDTNVPADFGFERHEWHIGSIEVIHTVVDRFTEEEHVRISKTASA